MIRFFGKRMGLSFSLEATDYLHERYGGHPLLTRMACSEVHDAIEKQARPRPLELTKADLVRDAEARDAELAFYCRHVVSELKKFYPDEYALLEMLAGGQVIDVMDLSDEPEYTRHLKEYGLLKINDVGRPSFAIPVVGQHVGNELARRERRRLVRVVVPSVGREGWVRRRTEMITREIRELSRVAEAKSLPMLYGDNSFPEAERLLGVPVVSTNDGFVTFINICNRCLVESVERTGKMQKKKDYYWTVVKQTYPDLWDGLQRVRIYRNNDLHLELTTMVEAELKRYIDNDLEGRRLAQVPEVYFVFQQSVLDGLLLGVQCELNRYS